MDSAVKLNKRAYKHAKELIQLDHVVLDERDAWSETPAGRAFKVKCAPPVATASTDQIGKPQVSSRRCSLYAGVAAPIQDYSV